MLEIHIATLCPQLCEQVLSESIIGRGRRDRKFTVMTHQIRDYSLDKQRRVDDYPYGGGRGMILQAEPIFRCYEAICETASEKPYVIYLSPKGTVFTQKKAVALMEHRCIMLLCGHYEGIDQRVIDELVDEEISIGDYVLTGGELPALVVTDTLARMCPGVLSEDICFEEESHFGGLLEYPQYTRPAVWHGREVPEPLLTGNHGLVDSWRHEQALAVTEAKRPDLFEAYQAEHPAPPKKEKRRRRPKEPKAE